MKKKMTVARALKEKSRLVEKIESLHDSISRYNSVELGERRPVDIRRQLEQLENCQANLLRVKEAIAQANAPIERKLAELMMLRAEIKFFQGLKTSEVEKSIVYDGSREVHNKVTCDVIVKEDESLAKQESLRERLDNVQDEVDSFNAVTDIEIALI